VTFQRPVFSHQIFSPTDERLPDLRRQYECMLLLQVQEMNYGIELMPTKLQKKQYICVKDVQIINTG